MPWNEPGGGSDKDPWSKGSSMGGKSNNIEDISKKMNEKLGGIFGKSGGDSGEGPSMTTLGLIALLALFAWLATGFYTIGAAEQGVEFRFGAYKRLTEPGWHWQFPRPIESVEIVNVDKAREAEDDNIHMLTKDENIINLSVSAQYKVKDVKDYLFNIIKPDFERDQPQGTLYQVMRSALREVAGRNTLDMILTENRASIASETQKEMQNILDQYGSGLELIKVNLTNATVPREVKEAFDDVTSAIKYMGRYIVIRWLEVARRAFNLPHLAMPDLRSKDGDHPRKALALMYPWYMNESWSASLWQYRIFPCSPDKSQNAISGSIIQNSARCLGVWEFSALNVGPNVYMSVMAEAKSSPSN